MTTAELIACFREDTGIESDQLSDTNLTKKIQAAVNELSCKIAAFRDDEEQSFSIESINLLAGVYEYTIPDYRALSQVSMQIDDCFQNLRPEAENNFKTDPWCVDCFYDCFFTVCGNIIKVLPIPTENIPGGLRVKYLPVADTSDANLSDLPEKWHHLISTYLLAIGDECKGDLNAKSYHMGEYNNMCQIMIAEIQRLYERKRMDVPVHLPVPTTTCYE